MATKEYFNSSNLSSFDHNISPGDKYNSINLNHGITGNFQKPTLMVDVDDRKKCGVDGSRKVYNAENYGITKGDQNSWNGFKDVGSTNGAPKYFWGDYQNETANRWRKKNVKENKFESSSTLSLHIAAYENAIDARNKAESSRDKVKYRKKAERIFSKVLFNNPFEIPRQSDGQPPVPEVMQFKASQRLRKTYATAASGTAASGNTSPGTPTSTKADSGSETNSNEIDAVSDSFREKLHVGSSNGVDATNDPEQSNDESEPNQQATWAGRLRNRQTRNPIPMSHFSSRYDKFSTKYLHLKNKKQDERKIELHGKKVTAKKDNWDDASTTPPNEEELSFSQQFDSPVTRDVPGTPPSINTEQAHSSAEWLPPRAEAFNRRIGDIPPVYESAAESDFSDGNCESDESQIDGTNHLCSDHEYPEMDPQAIPSMTIAQLTECAAYPDILKRDFGSYWTKVEALKSERKEIIRKLYGQLKKEKMMFTSAQCKVINAHIEYLEKELNEYIPVVGKLKAIFVRENTDVIMKRGFKYERFPESNFFNCNFIFRGIFECPCTSSLEIDENGCLTPKSFILHSHPPLQFNPNHDDPIPPPKEVEFPRVKEQKEGNKNYSKMIKLLETLHAEIGDLKFRAFLCFKDGKTFDGMLKEMEKWRDVPALDDSFKLRVRIAVSETKYMMERIYVHRPVRAAEK